MKWKSELVYTVNQGWNVKKLRQLTELLETILKDMDFADEVAVMVNGMGSTPEMELFIVNKTVQAILADKNIHPHQTFVGEYMTALEMTGCSITVLKLDEELKKLLDA